MHKKLLHGQAVQECKYCKLLALETLIIVLGSLG
jgi:hypothetical protein